MQTGLRRTLRVRAGEGRLLVVLGAILAAGMLAEQVGGIVAISGFLNTGGVNGILVVWIVDMVIGLAAAAAYSTLIDRHSRPQLMKWLLIGLAGCYAILVAVFSLGILSRLAYGAAVILADLQWVIFPLVFWVLASDVTDMPQAQRLFPVIAGVGFAGRLAGILLSFLAPGLLARLGIAPGAILALNVVVYLVALAFLKGVRWDRTRPQSPRKESPRKIVTEGWEFVREVPAFRFLALATGAGAVALTAVEFHFLATTQLAFPGEADLQRFYSLYRLALAATAMILQTLVTSRLIQRTSLKNAFLFMPLALLLGALVALGAVGLAPAVVALFLPKLVQSTVDQSATSTLRGLIPEERRGRVATFVSVIVPSLATILGALLIAGTLALTAGRSSTAAVAGYLALAVVFSGLAVWAILAMRSSYDASMLNWRLKRRGRGGAISTKLDL